MLNADSLPRLQALIAEADLDGWLLYDFRGLNPIAGGMLGLEGMVTRRVFAWVPREGEPVAVTHAIEQKQWDAWPAAWGREVYSAWRTLEATLARIVKGKRVAMEYSPGDAVPYVDWVPAGVLDMVRAAGAAEVVSSGDLVSRYYAVWTDDDRRSHERTAEQLARIAREALTRAGQRASAGDPLHEHELMRWIQEEFERLGLETDHGPNVSAGANAANPHYEPSPEQPRKIVTGDVLLIDLWAREKAADGRGVGMWADQTWMASVGAPSARAMEVWTAVCRARDAAIDYLRRHARADADPVRGGDVDDAARVVIERAGLGKHFTHRTGHSIDVRSLHGAGPHLDNLETREERVLVPGVGFSIEPGVYVAGEIGMRTEVNAYVTEEGVVITPKEYQKELMVV
jgi:Xaa-Pro dipeptidase